MWEQLMQMLSGMPTQGGVMPPGAAPVAMPGATMTPQTPAMQAPAANPAMNFANKAAKVGQDFTKALGGMGQTAQPPQMAAPPPPRPQPYQPNAGGLGTAGGGDPMQMLLMLPGIESILGRGAGGPAPDNMGNMQGNPGTAMPSLGELMNMGRRF